MRKTTFTMEEIRSMPRPAGYIEELAACALERDERQMTFDLDSPQYLNLTRKYRSHPRPAVEAQASEQPSDSKSDALSSQPPTAHDDSTEIRNAETETARARK